MGSSIVEIVCHPPFIRDRRAIADTRVASHGIVEVLDELECCNSGLCLRCESSSLQRLAFQRRKVAIAHGVVICVANRDHLGRTPASRQRLPNSIEVYCEP
jgi:hypothetical protein